MENERNRIKLEIIKKFDFKKVLKQQSKMIFARNHKSIENYDSSSFKQKEIKMDEPVYLRYSVLELS